MSNRPVIVNVTKDYGGPAGCLGAGCGCLVAVVLMFVALLLVGLAMQGG